MDSTMNTSYIKMFDCDPSLENLGPKWAKWIERLDQYFIASGIENDGRKLNSLFFIGGEELYEIYKTLNDITEFPEGVTSNYDKAKYKLTSYFNPKKNVVIEIYNFRQARQSKYETIYQYITRLKILAQYCDFGENLNKEIMNHVIQTCYSEKLRREFLSKKDLTYKDLVDLGRTHDNVEVEAKMVEGKTEIKEEEVYKLSTKRTRKSSKSCYRCGRDWPHTNETCPAIGKKCEKCSKLNHLAKVCRSEDTSKENINQIEIEEEDEDPGYLF